jgi:RNA recognition motif-containing protein
VVKRLVSMTALIVLALGLGVAKPALAAKKLFVGNLPYATTAADVQDLVSRYGAVMSISVAGMDVDGVMSAEATVAFERPRDAVAAADALHGMEVGGQPITANVKRVLVVGSKVKEVIREAGLRSDGELVQAVSDRVHELLAAAVKRCTSNGRSTVRPYDL